MKIGDYVNITATDEQFRELGHENKNTIKQLRKFGGVITGIVRPNKEKSKKPRSWIINKIFTIPETLLEVRNLKINSETGQTIKQQTENLESNEQDQETQRDND